MRTHIVEKIESFSQTHQSPEAERHKYKQELQWMRGRQISHLLMN